MATSSWTLADLAGNWRHTSFLLDPDSLIPATPPGAAKQSMAELWATGALQLEASAGGDTLTGKLTFPNGIELAITVREAPDLFGKAPGVSIEGSGAAPGPAGSVPLLYHLVGTLSPDWRKGGSEPVIVGAIRAAAFDPRGPTGTVGAFVLVRQ
ncbi:hypothetical protein [uncultured Thiodictyon sp.]|jgi:hypothetical protein|uniref:hypothetical protein n=1 Tax=uncultured Thiodictyon sp. TaxID=1846217 RepID=UPI0025F843DA|nr:hypothetical protein [uncultured Thiodictyon sp.]